MCDTNPPLWEVTIKFQYADGMPESSDYFVEADDEDDAKDQALSNLLDEIVDAHPYQTTAVRVEAASEPRSRFSADILHRLARWLTTPAPYNSKWSY